MSVETNLSKLSTIHKAIRNKLIALGVISNATAGLGDCNTALQAIVNQGGVDANVRDGETYTIPAGYHNGSGTVHGIAGGGSYNLQSKTITPTKEQQAIAPDAGYYGLSDVMVAAIPSNYADVSVVTAAAADTLAGKILVNASGQQVPGTIPDNGIVEKSIDGLSKTSVTIAAGYYVGGSVSLTSDIEDALDAIIGGGE